MSNLLEDEEWVLNSYTYGDDATCYELTHKTCGNKWFCFHPTRHYVCDKNLKCVFCKIRVPMIWQEKLVFFTNLGRL